MPIKTSIRLILVLSAWLNCVVCQASGSVTHFSRFSLEQGLSQNTVLSVLKDSYGFLWFGTGDGLNRFDGYTFKVFRHNAQSAGTDSTAISNYSLSNNAVKSLYEDSKGRLWVGTYGGGLNRYDAQSERFIHFRHDKSDSHSLSDDIILSIFEDSHGVLWVGTYSGGLNKFNEASGTFERFRHSATTAGSLSNDKVWAINEDADGRLWVGTANGLNRYDPANQSFEHYTNIASDEHSLSHHAVYAIHQDWQGELWVGTQQGLNQYDRQQQHFRRFEHQTSAPDSLSHAHVTSLFEDNTGTLWVGTEGGGLNRYDAAQKRFVHFKHDNTEPHSLSNNSVLGITQDAQGALWIGTFGGGLNKLDTTKQYFGHFKHQTADPFSLSHNVVIAGYKDASGTLWVGTLDGLNQYDAKTQQFTRFNHDATDSHSLSHNRINAIYGDSSDTLWVGTHGGGLNKFDATTKQFTHFKHQPLNPNSLSHNTVLSVYEDSQGTLWIGTDGGGLNKFDPKTADFKHYRHVAADPHSISHDGVFAIHEGTKGILWIGTDGGGINRFDTQTEQFERFQYQASNPEGLSHNIARVIFEDSKGILWIGTYGGGLNKYDKQTKKFRHYREKDGLPNEVIYAILEDDQGNLWISTNKGLSRFNPETETFRNYDVNDGLQSNEFNTRSAFKSADGELFFGGINGFNRFFAENIKDNDQPPKVVLTDFLLANQSVAIATDNPAIAPKSFELRQSIDALSQLSLSYQQNLIAFEFAALHFTNPMMNQYAYQLIGQDKDWIYTDAKNRRATYTNLRPGEYTLQIKASNSHGYWNQQAKSLKIAILPPPWRTWWAYSLYGLVFMVLIVAIIVAQGNKSRAQKQQIQIEKALNLRLKQVDKLKDEFLANTSHELRTPLNGIIGLAESLMDGVGGPQSNNSLANLAMIVSSGKRLSNLVNDILDFSKLKHSNLVLKTAAVDLYSMVEVVLTLSRPLLADKPLKLINAVSEALPAAQADEDRLGQILHNLVGNAIKFTDVGEVTVSAVQVADGLTIRVSDSGIGIKESQFDTIFVSFEQLEGETERRYSGTGLGLSVSKQLVELHHGTLTVESELGVGSTFNFTLPLANAQTSAENSAEKKPAIGQAVARLHSIEQDRPLIMPLLADSDSSRFRVLVVDDEPINRQVLHNHLSLQNYQLVEASDGEQALSIIAQSDPFDLILLDIMMPRVSGYEVCTQLRRSFAVNDLPVIFLTAKNQVADMMQSFAVGANDYLSKPISKHELLTRVETHLKFLDINRNLETKVLERTQALEQKNREIRVAQQQMVQSAKMASLGTLTAGVAHEINNPTNFVHVSVQNLHIDLSRFNRFIIDLAGDDADEDVLDSFKQQFQPLYQHLDTIQSGTKRIKAIVEDLRMFSQLDAAEHKNAKITVLLNATVNLIRSQYLETIEFVTDFAVIPELYCYPAQLNQVFMNLIVNACEAIAEKQYQTDTIIKGKVVICCRQLTDSVAITIEDNGAGMTAQTQSQLFEPFYTTKKVGDGTGLGLSIAYGIVQKHHGELSVNSTSGNGSTFLLKLPS